MKTKRKFNIYCILLLLVVSLQFGFSTLEDIKDSYNETNEEMRIEDDVDNQGQPKYYLTDLDVRSKTPWNLAVKNLKSGQTDSLRIYSVKAKVRATPELTKRDTIGEIGKTLFALVASIGIIAFWIVFFRLVLDVNRGEGFSAKTTWRLRFMGWMLILYFFCRIFAMLFMDYGRGLISYADFEIIPFAYRYARTLRLVLGIALLLFAQFFEMGRKMKEDQDLTI
ncbi:MAG: DUF2975 domain-containing protein [Prevotella sp.]|uniref:DUF2975 domain-containing protein n=1 Tax=Prevotella sp. AGR2160 TaxID=1280674 RepID=UPI000491C443|nr:DUF2975 domain-containing protein [Prevotella sp. AGR2160]MDD5861664.1 DUF2975 domain-containing protein [Prevotella sp.]